MKYKLFLLFLLFAKGFSQNAVLDSTFGVNGKVTTSFGSLITEIGDLAIQSDGKIIALGNIFNSWGLTLSRYNIDGSLDFSFGTDGKVINTEFFQCRAGGMKLTADGKIIIAASRRLGQTAGEDTLIIRYNSDGTLDSSFGQNGYVVTNLGTSIEISTDIIIQPDNKILVTSYENKIIRYLDSGVLDTSFGVNGIVTLSPLGNNISTSPFSNEQIFTAILQSDNKIIVSGITDVNHAPEDWDNFFLRYNIDGSIDTTFGINEFIVTDFGGRENGVSTIILNNDSFITTGSTFLTNNILQITLAKYTSSGILDTSFGTNGKVTTQTNNPNLFDFTTDIKLQTDGKILCVGQSGRGFNFDGGTSQLSDMLLLRYNQDGSLDTSFSPTGYLTTTFDVNIYNNGRAVAIQNDGKIVVGGSTLNLTTGGSFALARYTFDNLSNTSFTNKKSLSLVPNPANDFVKFDKEIVSVQVYTIDGKIIDFDFINNSIDVSRLSKGIYLVIGKNSNGELFENKLIKN